MHGLWGIAAAIAFPMVVGLGIWLYARQKRKKAVDVKNSLGYEEK